MNVLKAVQDYIAKLVGQVDGMKVLLLDAETMGIVSMVYAQSDILQKEVYLFERLDAPQRELMVHVTACVFVRPTDQNVQQLRAELAEPKYGGYHVFFSNVCSNALLDELAQADEHELVREVHEFFGDYFAVTPHAFTLNRPALFYSTRQQGWAGHKRRALDCLFALLLALRKRPAVRHVAQSELAEQVAVDLLRRVDEHGALFDFRGAKGQPPALLLVLDRKDDPVTPLLQQWTYQAMVHELLGLDNNRVNLSGAPGVRKDMKQLVLSVEQDTFYRDNALVNFGDLGVNIKALVDTYQRKTKSNESIQSIDDIKRFIDEFPEFRKIAGNVSKHVALVGELSRLIDSRQLFAISELEQELANKSDHSVAKTNVLEFIDKPEIKLADKLRLAALYALRYESSSSNATSRVIEALAAAGADRQQVRLIAQLIEYGGAARRSGDLYGNKTLFSMAKKSFKRGLSGTTNVYTEHQPLLAETLALLAKGKLREQSHPFVYGSAAGSAPDAVPREVIVFVVGGVTYEEVLTVERFNEEQNGRIIVSIGGTHIHNSHSFTKAVEASRS